jgi:hypothetical protein
MRFGRERKVKPSGIFSMWHTRECQQHILEGRTVEVIKSRRNSQKPSHRNLSTFSSHQLVLSLRSCTPLFYSRFIVYRTFLSLFFSSFLRTTNFSIKSLLLTMFVASESDLVSFLQAKFWQGLLSFWIECLS